MSNMEYLNTITITYGDKAENNVGMKKIGLMATSGLTCEDLEKAKELFEKNAELEKEK